MSKKLDTAPVINELKGESAFFRSPANPSSQDEMKAPREAVPRGVPKRIFPPLPASQETSQVSVSVRPVDPSSDRTGDWRAGRETVRHAFEFYRDQIGRLKEMRRQALMENQKFSMSEIVRTALDQYLTKLEASDHSYDRPVERTGD